MEKRSYIIPELEVVEIKSTQQMLAGSVVGVTGLDDDMEQEEYDPSNPVVW